MEVFIMLVCEIVENYFKVLYKKYGAKYVESKSFTEIVKMICYNFRLSGLNNMQKTPLYDVKEMLNQFYYPQNWKTVEKTPIHLEDMPHLYLYTNGKKPGEHGYKFRFCIDSMELFEEIRKEIKKLEAIEEAKKAKAARA